MNRTMMQLDTLFLKVENLEKLCQNIRIESLRKKNDAKFMHSDE